MKISKFDRILPWTGAVAGLLWALWLGLSKTPDHPADPGAVALVEHAAGRNYAAGFALLVGGFMLIFFAAQARKSLRSGEAGESTYSSVAHGGLVVAAGGFGLLGIVQIALVNTAKAHDAAATDAIGQLVMIGWLPVLVGVAAGFWGLGLGGLRTATLPKWFAITTIVFAVIAVLGPLAFVVYLLLPLWLIAASAVTARRAAGTPGSPSSTLSGTTDPGLIRQQA
jgi:uncharacterized membrane protein